LFNIFQFCGQIKSQGFLLHSSKNNQLKTLILTFSLLFATVTLHGQETKINFLNIELDSAYKIAKSENKLLFVDCYTTWCGPCKYMEANIFTNSEVAKYYNDNFINVKLDMEKGEGEVFAGWYEVRSYPTYIFLDLSGRGRQLAHRIVGSMDAESFMQFAKDAQNEDVRIGEMRNRYFSGERNPEFIRNYIEKLYDSGYSSDARDISYWLYQDLDWSSIDSTDANILLSFITGKSHPLHDGMMNNLSNLEKVADQEMLYGALTRGYMTAVWQGLRSDDPSKNFEQALKEINTLDYSRKEQVKWEVSMFYYEQQGEDEYFDLAAQFGEKYCFDDATRLNSIAWTMYEMTSDKKILINALKLVERSVVIEADLNNLDTKMRILYALNKKKEALSVGAEISTIIESSEAFSDKKASHEEVLKAMKAGNDISELN
jgi:thioredoxin-related protein